MEPPERAEKGLRRLGAPVDAVIEKADQRRHAERARHQHRLVVRVGGKPADFVKDGGRGAELGLGQPHLAHEGVQMLDQRDQNFAQARVFGSRHGGERVEVHVVDVADDHSSLARPAARPLVVAAKAGENGGAAGSSFVVRLPL